MRASQSPSATNGTAAVGRLSDEHAKRIRTNADIADRLTSIVEHRLRAGRDESVLAWARVTGAFETTNPTGRLRNVRVERALDVVSRRALAPSPDRTTGGSVQRVLHVLSESHLIGGHVRMAGRWARVDTGRTARFVITRPGCDGHGLRRTARDIGAGHEVLLGRSMIGRAAQLRALTAGADVVVCHTHGDDPVPAVAFGGSYDGPPVVLVNHADHVFWFGTGNVSTIAQLRSTGAEVTADARGYSRDCFATLPIPIEIAARNTDVARAKLALGIDPDRLVALTLARPTKYAPSDFHPGFLEVVMPVLATSDCVLLAVGPSPTDSAWAAAAEQLGGRAIFPGLRPDPLPYLDAADLYLDSFPFCSNTSMLEAASRSLPILTSRQHQGLARLHGSEGMLGDSVIGPRSTEEYRTALRTLLADSTLRETAGRRSLAAMLAVHGRESWLGFLEALYDHATAAEPVRERAEPGGCSEQQLVEYAAVLQGIESASPLLWTLMNSLDAFDTRDRAILWSRISAARTVDRVTRHTPSAADHSRLLLPFDKVAR